MAPPRGLPVSSRGLLDRRMRVWARTKALWIDPAPFHCPLGPSRSSSNVCRRNGRRMPRRKASSVHARSTMTQMVLSAHASRGLTPSRMATAINVLRSNPLTVSFQARGRSAFEHYPPDEGLPCHLKLDDVDAGRHKTSA